MPTNNSSQKDQKDIKGAAANDDTNEISQDAPQIDANYKPDANVLTDNRRSDYDQPNLHNPDSQAVRRDIFEDGEEADKAENHKGDPAWDVNVKLDGSSTDQKTKEQGKAEAGKQAEAANEAAAKSVNKK